MQVRAHARGHHQPLFQEAFRTRKGLQESARNYSPFAPLHVVKMNRKMPRGYPKGASCLKDVIGDHQCMPCGWLGRHWPCQWHSAAPGRPHATHFVRHALNQKSSSPAKDKRSRALPDCLFSWPSVLSVPSVPCKRLRLASILASRSVSTRARSSWSFSFNLGTQCQCLRHTQSLCPFPRKLLRFQSLAKALLPLGQVPLPTFRS